MSKRFFYFMGLGVFLYGGLKVSDYSERYLKKSDVLYVSLIDALSKIKPRAIMAETQKKEEPQLSKQSNKVENQKQTEEQKEPFFDPLFVTSPSEVEMLEALGKRREKIEEREKKLAERELQQSIVDKKLQTQLVNLKIIQEEIFRQLDQLDKAEVDKEKSLSRIYENMKPKDAAKVIDALDLPIAIGVLKRMSEKKLAAILAYVSVERARDITNDLSQKTKTLAKEKAV